MNAKLLLTCMLLSGMLVGCAQDRRVWTTEDSWYTSLPSGTGLWEWEELDPTRIHEVVGSSLSDAEALLEDVPSADITSSQAAEFVGEPLHDIPGTKLCLVRGVLLNRATGSFTVYVLEDQLAVYHRSLGRSAVPMTRQPLVLQLERRPAEVFVACSMAE